MKVYSGAKLAANPRPTGGQPASKIANNGPHGDLCLFDEMAVVVEILVFTNIYTLTWPFKRSGINSIA